MDQQAVHLQLWGLKKWDLLHLQAVNNNSNKPLPPLTFFLSCKESRDQEENVIPYQFRHQLLSLSIANHGTTIYISAMPTIPSL